MKPRNILHFQASKIEAPVWNADDEMQIPGGKNVLNEICELLEEKGYSHNVIEPDLSHQSYFTTFRKDEYKFWVQLTDVSPECIICCRYQGHTNWLKGWLPQKAFEEFLEVLHNVISSQVDFRDIRWFDKLYRNGGSAHPLSGEELPSPLSSMSGNTELFYIDKFPTKKLFVEFVLSEFPQWQGAYKGQKSVKFIGDIRFKPGQNTPGSMFLYFYSDGLFDLPKDEAKKLISKLGTQSFSKIFIRGANTEDALLYQQELLNYLKQKLNICMAG